MSFDLGEEIRKAREAMNLSKRALSGITGIPQPTLSRIESGQSQGSREHLATISKALNISPGRMLGLKEQPLPPFSCEVTGTIQGAFAEMRGTAMDSIKIKTTAISLEGCELLKVTTDALAPEIQRGWFAICQVGKIEPGRPVAVDLDGKGWVFTDYIVEKKQHLFISRRPELRVRSRTSLKRVRAMQIIGTLF